jgi:hypothetical protein
MTGEPRRFFFFFFFFRRLTHIFVNRGKLRGSYTSSGTIHGLRRGKGTSHMVICLRGELFRAVRLRRHIWNITC